MIKKKIMGRIVECCEEDKTIKIYLNNDDFIRHDLQIAEFGHVLYHENNAITEKYFRNEEFLKLHNKIFGEEGSIQMESWTTEDKNKYLEIREEMY